MRIDQGADSKEYFDRIMGIENLGKKKKIEAKMMILYMLGCIPDISNDEKARFAFNLFDYEDSRMITILELKKILAGFYFATFPHEV